MSTYVEKEANIEKLKELTDRLIEKDEALVLRANYLQGLVNIQDILLRNNDPNIFDTVVRTLGELTGYSRVYMYRNISENDAVLLAQWTHKYIENNPIDSDIIHYNNFEVICNHLKLHLVFNKLVKDMPDILRDYYNPYHTKATLIVPIFINNIFWGFLGVDNTEEENLWGPQIINLFTSVASSLSTYIKNSEIFKLKTALDYSGKVFMITDVRGEILYVNKLFTEIYQYTLDDVRYRKSSILKSGIHDDQFYSKIWQQILDGNVWRGEFINKRKDGKKLREISEIIPIIRVGEGSNTIESIQGFINIKEVVGTYDG